MTPRDEARRLARAAIRGDFRPEALHVYTDEKGEPIYWRIRARLPDGSKWIRPMRRNGDGCELGEPDFPNGKPLYRLHDLAANPGAPVWYVEGENCADALAKLDVLATTAGSAQSDERAEVTPLKGRMITIWPDNDKPGIEHAQRVAAKLRALGCDVEIIDAPTLGLEQGGDCVDWLKTHTYATAADLAMLPRTKAKRESVGIVPARVELVSGTDVKPEPIEWLWDGWLARGKFHQLGGAPGTGKTTLALAFAATISTGGRWPDGTRATAGNVLIWSGEDDPTDTLAPRLIASGADMSRIHFLGSVTETTGKRRCFDPATDIEVLKSALAEHTAVSLLIVDPVVNAVTGDGHSNSQVRRSLQPLVDLGSAIGCAVLGITHLSKGTAGRDPVERLNGSIAFGALPRVVMMAFKRSEDEGGGRAVVRAKSNIGPDTGGYCYELIQAELRTHPGLVASHLEWGDALEGTARELLATAEVVDDGDERGGTEEAADLLKELLSAEPMHAKEATGKLRHSGYSDKQIRLARERLGIKSAKQGFGADAFTVWTLPNTCPQSSNLPKDAPLGEGASRASMGTLGGQTTRQDSATGDDQERF